MKKQMEAANKESLKLLKEEMEGDQKNLLKLLENSMGQLYEEKILALTAAHDEEVKISLRNKLFVIFWFKCW